MKRENNRGINQRYFHVRDISQTLDGRKCQTIQIPDPDVSFKDMYHYCTCKELVIGRAVLRRVHCNFNARDEIIRKEWVYGAKSEEQPRFADSPDCFFKPVLCNSNYWYLVDIILSVNDEDQEDLDAENHEVLHHFTSTVSESVDIGEIGAIATGGEDADDGYYLVNSTK